MNTYNSRIPALLQSKATLADAVSIRKWTTLKDGWVSKTTWDLFLKEGLPQNVLQVYPENPNLPEVEYIKVKVTIDV
jgi:hypothetical protein